MIVLRNSINSKDISENENPKKVVNIVEKILEFNKPQKGKGIKILTPKQMLPRLPIGLAQVKAGNTSANLLNEIRQIIYSLHRAKGITKKVYNNIINSIKLQNRMGTIFVNSKNSKKSNLHKVLINLSDKINLKRSDKYVALSNLSIYYTLKNIKSHTKIINSKYQL